MATTGLRAVVSREFRYLGRQPWDLALLLWFPAATLALLLWLFSAGVPTGLPIAVVDEDHGSASRDLIRRMASMRGLAITAQPESLEAAQPLVRSGAVYGVVHIPSNWERDRLRNAPQPVVLYENAQFSLVAGIIGGDVRAAVTLDWWSSARWPARHASAAAWRRRRRGSAACRPTCARCSTPRCPTRPTWPACCCRWCCTCFASSLRCLRSGASSATAASMPGWPALAAACRAPWSASSRRCCSSYLLFALLMVATFAGWRGWTPAGSLALWVVAIAVLMIVSVTVAVMLVGITINLRLALSLTGIYVATGLAFSGFSFPRAAMGPAAQWWGGLLPYTYYLPVQQGQWLGGASASAWAQGMAPLLLFIVVPLLVGLPLLGRAVRQPHRWGGR